MDFGAILGAVITLSLAAIGGVVWMVRLEGRINTETSLRENQHQNFMERLGGFELRIYEMLKDIQETLRAKVDK